jgi:hypothetical protein
MNRIIYKKIEIHLNSKNAFEWFVLENKVTSWLCEKANIETKKGGKYELYWNLKNIKHNNTVGCKINIYDYGKVLGFNWKGPREFHDFMNKIQPLTQVTIFFNHLENDKTEIILIHSGWKNSEQWQKAFEWYQLAWDESLKQLHKVINTSENKNFW